MMKGNEIDGATLLQRNQIKGFIKLKNGLRLYLKVLSN
jgi:hypothetical protein